MSIANNEVIIRMVGKLTLEFPEIDQLKVRGIVEECLYKYDIVPQELGLVVSDVEDRLMIYLAVKKLDGLVASTLKNYKENIIKFSNMLRKPIASVTTMDLRMYLANRCKNMKSTTTNEQIFILKSFFGWLFTEEYIPKNPTTKLKPTKVPSRLREALSVEEIEILRQKCSSIREKALFEFTYSTGCRLAEIASVNKEDIDWNNKTLRVIGKGNKERVVCFNTKAKYLLKEYIMSRNDDNSALFITTKSPNTRLGKRSIQREIGIIAGRANLGKAIYPHLLRHSIATHLLAAGMALHNVQALLGHSNPKTTQIYAETSVENVVYEYKRIS